VVDDDEEEVRDDEEGDSEDDEARGDLEIDYMRGGDVRAWITEGRKRKAVKRRFKDFLLNFEAATGENR